MATLVDEALSYRGRCGMLKGVAERDDTPIDALGGFRRDVRRDIGIVSELVELGFWKTKHLLGRSLVEAGTIRGRGPSLSARFCHVISSNSSNVVGTKLPKSRYEVLQHE
jgi:hypothetical protein